MRGEIYRGCEILNHSAIANGSPFLSLFPSCARARWENLSLLYYGTRERKLSAVVGLCYITDEKHEESGISMAALPAGVPILDPPLFFFLFPRRIARPELYTLPQP